MIQTQNRNQQDDHGFVHVGRTLNYAAREISCALDAYISTRVSPELTGMRGMVLGDHFLCKAGNAGADLPGLSASAAGRHCLHGRLHSVRIGQAQEVDALRISHFRRSGGAA